MIPEAKLKLYQSIAAFLKEEHSRGAYSSDTLESLEGTKISYLNMMHLKLLGSVLKVHSKYLVTPGLKLISSPWFQKLQYVFMQPFTLV